MGRAGWFGPVASDPTVSNLIDTPAGSGPRALAAIRRARAEARQHVWLVLSPLTGTGAVQDTEKLPAWSFYQASCCSLETYDTNLRLRQANHDAERALNLSEAEMRGLRHAEPVAHPEFASAPRRRHRERRCPGCRPVGESGRQGTPPVA